MTVSLVLTSCADQYRLQGTTSIHALEGKTLYLKVFQDDDLHNLDSCKVTHGKFAFKGTLDSVMMANLFADQQSLMPVVIEGGDLTVCIDEMTQQMSGSPLNDTLYSFIRQKTQIDNKLAELPQREGRMVMDGMDHDEVMEALSADFRLLTIESDELVTGFIKRNYDNVLGPGIFMIMTSAYPYPMLTPQVEEILATATPRFTSNPYVVAYLKMARANMEKLQER